MTYLTKIEEKHSAGAQSAGFDYQFYCFTFLLLGLTHGQKLGFEVRDDVHIDKPDGTVSLFQTKHTVQKNKNGEAINLTQLDTDLWKTISNWTEMIWTDSSILDNYTFHLITNKNETNNAFIIAVELFKETNDINALYDILTELKRNSKSDEIKGYLSSIISIGKRKLKPFFANLIIETSCDNIINKIKIRILDRALNDALVDPIYEKLVANLLESKYIDIGEKGKFEITFEDFKNKFGKCFKDAFKDKPLPKRTFPIHLPENLDKQIFIKQLVDIGEIPKDSPKIVDYTTTMLQTLNNFNYWIERDLLSITDFNDFERETILLWDNEFRSKYRKIEKQIADGVDISTLEKSINDLAVELVDFVRRKELTIDDKSLGIEFSNGHFYSLSDTPKIGWHIDWKNKYE